MRNPTSSTIRSQLLWASLFPLAAFGLLAILLISAAFRNLTLDQSLQRDTALARVAAAQVSERFNQLLLPLQDAARDPAFTPQSASFDRLSAELAPLHAHLVAVDPHGVVVGASPAAPVRVGQTVGDLSALHATPGSAPQPVLTTLPPLTGGEPSIAISVPIRRGEKITGWLQAILPTPDGAWLAGVQLPLAAASRLSLFDQNGDLIAQNGPAQAARRDWLFAGDPAAHSRLIDSPGDGDQIVYAYAPVAGTGWGIALEEPWTALFASAANYAWALAALLALGTVLSIWLLSASLGRVIRPLSELSRLANSLGPGSVFHPLAEEGPDELRALTRAFNQMVIRLAEQQGALRQYAEKALLSQEEERQRLSHELHDETVQELVGLLQRVDLCQTEMEHSPERARLRLVELKTLAEQALGDLRRISNALRPSILQDLGLVPAVRSLCDEMERQMPGISCEFGLEGEERRLAPEIELAIFRVAQEALSNIRRHADQVSQVSVTLRFEADCLHAVIQDDGQGFPQPDVRALVREGHLGVAGMYERARLFGGELAIESDPQAGTTVTLRMPVAMGITLAPH